MFGFAGASGWLGSLLAEFAVLLLTFLLVTTLENADTLFGVGVSLILLVFLVLWLDFNKDYLFRSCFFLDNFRLMGRFNDLLDGLGFSLFVLSFLFGLGVFGADFLDLVLF